MNAYYISGYVIDGDFVVMNNKALIALTLIACFIGLLTWQIIWLYRNKDNRIKPIVSVILIITDIVFTVLFEIFMIPFLRSTVGFDVVVMENWFGDIEDPIVYRFGAGCWEITITFVKTIGYITGQCILLKGQSKMQFISSILLHIGIGILGFMYIFEYAEGHNFLDLIRLILKGGY